jgi:AcrR family transcriptional regulator
MSHKRFENLDPQRQQRLFDAAAEEFGDEGYEAASLNRILDKSGMSKSSLYYYFDNKADLFTTMIERSIAALFREIGGFDLDALTAGTFWSEIDSLFQRAVVVTNERPWYVKLGRLFYWLRGSPKESAPTGRMFNAARTWTGMLIKRGQELGVVRTDLPISLLTESIMGLGEAVDRWIVEHWSELNEAERIDTAKNLIELFQRLASAQGKADVVD